jgi:hypothetical protein
MGLLSWLTSTRPTEATDEPPASSKAGERGDIFSRLINVPSRNFAGISSQSPNKRFTIAWLDGGPDQSRTGRYLLLDGRSVVAEGKLPRPNDGLVTDEGIFVLNDWGPVETLNGTFLAFAANGRKLLERKFRANLFNNGLSPDGRYAVCQTANAPGPDGNLLTIFDLAKGTEIGAWQPESGWASYYEFPAGTETIRLGYRERGAFAYTFDGTFLDRMKWLAAGLREGDLITVERLLSDCENKPTPELASQLLPAIDLALTRSRADDLKTRARALRSRGICFEAVAEVKQALNCYEEALTLDPKVGVKRKADQLRKVL